MCIFSADCPDHYAADWVKEIKRVSSIWINKENPVDGVCVAGRLCVFSVSSSAIDKTRAYIAGQQEHHENKHFRMNTSVSSQTRHGMG